MKFKVAVLLSMMLIIISVLSGCSNGANTPDVASTVKQIKVITSFYPMYVHTINICKGIAGVNVVNLTKPQTGCLHDYAITTDDMKTLESGQVFVINGLGIENFMDKVLGQMPNLKIVEASKNIELIKDDSGESEYNPHVWVSLSDAMIQVRNIAQQLCEINPENAEKYKSNAELYAIKLQAESYNMHKFLDGIKNRNIVTFHKAFPYFAKEFNLNIVAVVEREPGTDPSPKELTEAIKIVKESKTKAIFAEPQYPSKAADMIAKETGAKVYLLDPAVTGEANGDYDAYLKIMDKNFKVLEEAFK